MVVFALVATAYVVKGHCEEAPAQTGSLGANVSMPLGPSAIKVLETDLENTQKAAAQTNDQLDAALEALLEIPLAKADSSVVEQTLADRRSQVQRLMQQKKEQNLRMNFLAEFLGKIRNKNIESTTVINILLTALKDMARVDLVSSQESHTEAELWEFETNLALALKEGLEPMENYGEFILDYMNWSTISSADEHNPAEYLKKERAYRGGNPEFKNQTKQKPGEAVPSNSPAES